jgi:hypothetical protein
VLAIVLACRGTLAGTVVLPPARDNTLYEESGALSNGAGQYLFTGRNGSGWRRRALLAFDIAGSVPPGSLITSTRLTLTMNMTPGGLEVVSLRRLFADWGEGTSAASGSEGGGALAAPGDATWTHAFFPGVLWSAPGGDFAASMSASTPVDAAGVYSWSSAGMLADVQAWRDDPANNFGWILNGGEDGPSATAKRYGSWNNLDPSLRPRLCVAFCPGSCAGAVPDGGKVPGTPLQIEIAEGGDLLLSWGTSCAGSDSDYEIYEGVLGDFTSHAPLACSTGGATTATITSSEGSRYYIVVPRSATREGSYGVDSNDKERPPSATSCLIQSVASCCL